MQRATDQVDVVYFQQSPPRPLPYVVVLNLLGDYTFERPSAILDPLMILGLVGVIAFTALQTSPALIAVPLAVVLFRVAVGVYWVGQRAWADMSLLRKGLIVRAHILKLRPHRTLTGEINGALLDCAIPVAQRRTYIGTVWLEDGNEALRLARQAQVEVICLPRTPGTWRLLEPVRSEVRYERMGPVAEIPPA